MRTVQANSFVQKRYLALYCYNQFFSFVTSWLSRRQKQSEAALLAVGLSLLLGWHYFK